jgi:hypothetical protein
MSVIEAQQTYSYMKTTATQGVAYAPSGKLSVGVWNIRFREKWNMVKIDDQQ